MEIEMFLDANARFLILDATAGFRKMWKGKHQGVLFLDKRKEVKPHIVASNEMLPFRDGVFEKVVYDPPFWIEKYLLDGMKMFPTKEEAIRKYGVSKDRWELLRNILAVNKEFHRVLKEKGVLYMKYTNVRSTRITHQYVINLLDKFEVKRIRAQLSRSNYRTRNTTFFITFHKK